MAQDLYGNFFEEEKGKKENMEETNLEICLKKRNRN